MKMTNNEIIAELAAVEEEVYTAPTRFLLAQRMKEFTTVEEVKAEVYRQGHRVAKMVRENSGEVELVDAIEKSMHWLEHATRYNMDHTGSWHIEKIVTTIKNLHLKAKTRGLEQVIQVTEVTPQENPLYGELEKTKADLNVANRELVKAREEIRELKDRPPKLPSKEEMTMKWVFLNMPRWLVFQLLMAYLLEFGLAALAFGKIGYEVYNWRTNQATNVPTVQENSVIKPSAAPAKDTGFNPTILDAQRPGAVEK
jgi:hypothetical protein